MDGDDATAARVADLAMRIAAALAADPHPCAAASARWMVVRAMVELTKAARHLGVKEEVSDE